MFKFLGGLVVLAAAAVLLILFWPQLFGLETTWIIAQAVSLRGVMLVGVLALALVTALFLAVRRIRLFAAAMTVTLLAFSAATGVLLLQRGIDNTSPVSDAATDEVTVLAWNTLGDAPGAEAIARLAVNVGADIVSLPETTEGTGIEVAKLMRDLGSPMWVHTTAFDQISPARSTTVLVSPRLGDYEKVTSNTERSNNTAVLPTVIVKPADGDGPTIVAVHAVAPISDQMTNWRNDLAWLARQCTTDNVIMAGDFNSTIDHMAGLGSFPGATLGACTDSALQAGSAGVGTWPTDLPELAGSPIDHVMSTSAWVARDVHIVTDQDASGSDHRPIVAHLARS